MVVGSRCENGKAETAGSLSRLLVAPAPVRPDANADAWSPAIAIITIGPIAVAVTVVRPISITIVRAAIAVIATAIVSSVIDVFDGRIGFRLSRQDRKSTRLNS